MTRYIHERVKERDLREWYRQLLQGILYRGAEKLNCMQFNICQLYLNKPVKKKKQMDK